MDLHYGEEYEKFRSELRAFLAGWPLAGDEARLPRSLVVSARSPEGEVMAVRHRARPAEGVQFHPESVLTGEGRALLANWIAGCAGEARA